MKPFDKHYLRLQFTYKIYSKNGAEFQSFFESIMEKVYPEFSKVPSGGGDGGNDGWIKNLGRYYQVYAPNTPAIKDSEAATKLKKDFYKLKKNWDHISEIKEYYFVFNDKYFGSIKPEEAIAELRKEEPNILFNMFLAKDLEQLFFTLDETDIMTLGFNIDSRRAISIANEYLEKVQVELDRQCAKFAYRKLEDSRDMISKLDDGRLSLEFELLECRCLHKLEKVEEAKEKYKSISKRYPEDPRALLYLAEILLNNYDYDANEALLAKAAKIDRKHWLLKLQELVRKDHLDEMIDVNNINEDIFPDDKRIRANLYRLYAIFLEKSKYKVKADSFIEKAIHLNPNSFLNYIAKLSFAESRLILNENNSQRLQEAQELLNEINRVENEFIDFGDIGARNKANLNFRRLTALNVQENYMEFEKISQKAFYQVITCYFDKQISQMLSGLMMAVSMPDDDLNQLLKYLYDSNKDITDELSKALILQFNMREKLFDEGEKYFRETNNKKYLNFINDLENKNYDNILRFLKDDIKFAVAIVNTFKNLPELRRKIIDYIPDKSNIQKEKLLLLLNYDENKFDEAFEILKQIDISNLHYLECKPILRVIQEKKAWDFEVILLEKLLEKEQDGNVIFYLKLQLFDAYFNLKKHTRVIDIGEELLNQDSVENILNIKNREVLLVKTILACFERGKVDSKAFNKSKEILERHQSTQPTFEFKIDIEANVHLYNGEPNKALEAIIEGVIIRKLLTPEEYGKLYFLMTIKIGNQIDLILDSLRRVEENTFVKLRNRDRWYLIGNDNELDAIRISKENDYFSLFIDKKIGEKIVFEDKFSSDIHEEIVENIFTIEKYILWKAQQNFHSLSQDNLLDGVRRIEVPENEGIPDLTYAKLFLEDQNKRTEPFFKAYCENNIPLAMLAVNEGGLTNAIGRIQRENRGFINFSTGTVEELDQQKNIAKKVIDEKISFYIDGTSALMLSETGLIKRVYDHLPNIKIPQSVLSLMMDCAERFRYTRGQVGYIRYSQGEISISSIEKERRERLHSNFIDSITLLESKPDSVSMISLANKADCFSEHNVPGEVSDACILAQKENLPVLTEDFLYLKMNELETKKESPEYFSSLVLVRVLYEMGEVSFNEYLDYFAYLSSYRFRFLSLSQEDVEKAVFGDGDIKVVNIENIRKFNFTLTLAEEYGVPFKLAFNLVGRFLLLVLDDETILPEIIDRIFIEIIETFPREKDKKVLAQMLLSICRQTVGENKSSIIIDARSEMLQKKLDKLSQAAEIYTSY